MCCVTLPACTMQHLVHNAQPAILTSFVGCNLHVPWQHHAALPACIQSIPLLTARHLVRFTPECTSLSLPVPLFTLSYKSSHFVLRCSCGGSHSRLCTRSSSLTCRLWQQQQSSICRPSNHHTTGKLGAMCLQLLVLSSLPVPQNLPYLSMMILCHSKGC